MSEEPGGRLLALRPDTDVHQWLRELADRPGKLRGAFVALYYEDEAGEESVESLWSHSDLRPSACWFAVCCLHHAMHRAMVRQGAMSSYDGCDPDEE